ncbi:MAG: putative acyl-CoA thioesterase YneP, partial [Bacteroidota bacterium]
NYARLYEIARVEMLRSLGISYKKLEDEGIGLPVVENFSRFHLAAKYDDLLTITCQIKDLPNVRIIFDYLIYNQDQVLIHEGKTTLVFMNMVQQKVIRIPEIILLAMKDNWK